ncbi:MAG: response regulator, partial [Rhodospirillaceae bacterium]|nr:response regulator [Rhodospirillaceae bacterium]
MNSRTDTNGVAPTVYVIDDDKAVRESLQWLIESDDLPVETYASAMAFLSRCEFGDLGCVLADVRMPEMSGL